MMNGGFHVEKRARILQPFSAFKAAEPAMVFLRTFKARSEAARKLQPSWYSALRIDWPAAALLPMMVAFQPA